MDQKTTPTKRIKKRELNRTLLLPIYFEYGGRTYEGQKKKKIQDGLFFCSENINFEKDTNIWGTGDIDIHRSSFQPFSISLIFVICRLLCGSNIYACICIYFKHLFFRLVYVYLVASCTRKSFTNDFKGSRSLKLYFRIVKLYIRYLLKACFALFVLFISYRELRHCIFILKTTSFLQNEFAGHNAKTLSASHTGYFQNTSF